MGRAPRRRRTRACPGPACRTSRSGRPAAERMSRAPRPPARESGPTRGPGISPSRSAARPRAGRRWCQSAARPPACPSRRPCNLSTRGHAGRCRVPSPNSARRTSTASIGPTRSWRSARRPGRRSSARMTTWSNFGRRSGRRLAQPALHGRGRFWSHGCLLRSCMARAPACFDYQPPVLSTDRAPVLDDLFSFSGRRRYWQMAKASSPRATGCRPVSPWV